MMSSIVEWEEECVVVMGCRWLRLVMCYNHCTDTGYTVMVIECSSRNGIMRDRSGQNRSDHVTI